MERQQDKINAGALSASFPDVSSIVVNMKYNQKGIHKALLRTVNFFPSSYAYFRIDCLSNGCVNGGFDLTQVINSMTRNRSEAAKGDLGCEGTDPSANHSEINYEISIQYT